MLHADEDFVPLYIYFLFLMPAKTNRSRFLQRPCFRLFLQKEELTAASVLEEHCKYRKAAATPPFNFDYATYNKVHILFQAAARPLASAFSNSRPTGFSS